MNARKKPGPHPENPLEFSIKTRIDKGTMEELEYCKEKLNVNGSEIVRRGIHKVYEELVEK